MRFAGHPRVTARERRAAYDSNSFGVTIAADVQGVVFRFVRIGFIFPRKYAAYLLLAAFRFFRLLARTGAPNVQTAYRSRTIKIKFHCAGAASYGYSNNFCRIPVWNLAEVRRIRAVGMGSFDALTTLIESGGAGFEPHRALLTFGLVAVTHALSEYGFVRVILLEKRVQRWWNRYVLWSFAIRHRNFSLLRARATPVAAFGLRPIVNFPRGVRPE